MGSDEVETTKVSAFRDGRDSLSPISAYLSEPAIQKTYRCHFGIEVVQTN